MNIERKKIIDKVFKDIHGDRVPMFRWVNHASMEYYYNEETDTLDCDCGIFVDIHLEDNEITYSTLIEVIYLLEEKVHAEFHEKHNIYLHYGD